MILYGNIAWQLFQESNNKSPMTKAKTLEISFDLSMSNFVSYGQRKGECLCRGIRNLQKGKQGFKLCINYVFISLHLNLTTKEPR